MFAFALETEETNSHRIYRWLQASRSSQTVPVVFYSFLARIALCGCRNICNVSILFDCECERINFLSSTKCISFTNPLLLALVFPVQRCRMNDAKSEITRTKIGVESASLAHVAQSTKYYVCCAVCCAVCWLMYISLMPVQVHASLTIVTQTRLQCWQLPSAPLSHTHTRIAHMDIRTTCEKSCGTDSK